VCDKCEKKLSHGAVPDVWKDGSRNVGAGRDGGKSLARNTILAAHGKTATKFAPSLKTCRICKSKLSQDGEYCNQCAFSKGICAMCGVAIADLKFDKRGLEGFGPKAKVPPAEEVDHADAAPASGAGKAKRKKIETTAVCHDITKRDGVLCCLLLRCQKCSYQPLNVKSVGGYRAFVALPTHRSRRRMLSPRLPRRRKSQMQLGWLSRLFPIALALQRT